MFKILKEIYQYLDKNKIPISCRTVKIKLQLFNHNNEQLGRGTKGTIHI